MSFNLKYLIVLISVTSILPNFIFSQNDTDHELLLKYWYYRDRLKYFVYPGIMMGESEMAGVRNKLAWDVPDTRNLDFGQNGVYFGYYLGLLATEYRLLMNNGEGGLAVNTGAQVNHALYQFINYMDKCEEHWNVTPVWDGFFIRNSVPIDFLNPASPNGYGFGGDLHVIGLNSELTYLNTYNNNTHHIDGFELQDGHPGYIVHNSTSNNILGGVPPIESMSMDEGIGVLMGLALVMFNMQDYPVIVPGTGGKTVKQTARECGKKIVETLYHNGLWELTDPLGTSIQSTVLYDYGIAKTGWYFGMPLPIYWYYPSPGYAFAYSEWYLLPQINTGLVFNETMETTLSAISDGWHDHTQSSIVDNTWPYWIHTFYSILFDVLHYDIPYNPGIYDLMKLQLSYAPGEGPYNFGDGYHPDNGWAYTYKWRGTLNEQNNGSVKGIFSGADYMLAYNMYAIGKGVSIGDYHPLHEIVLIKDFPVLTSESIITGGTTNPFNVVAFNEIYSRSKIWNSTKFDFQGNIIEPPMNESGKVNYIAGDVIMLTQGFYVEKGAKFTATTKKPICWNDYSINSSDPYQSSSILVIDQLDSVQTNPVDVQRHLLNFSSDNQELPLQDIAVFPNPATSYFTLKCENVSFGNLYCNIFDMHLDLKFSTKINANFTKIPCESFLTGMYVIHIQGDSFIHTLKLVKM